MTFQGWTIWRFSVPARGSSPPPAQIPINCVGRCDHFHPCSQAGGLPGWLFFPRFDGSLVPCSWPASKGCPLSSQHTHTPPRMSFALIDTSRTGKAFPVTPVTKRNLVFSSAPASVAEESVEETDCTLQNVSSGGIGFDAVTGVFQTDSRLFPHPPGFSYSHSRPHRKLSRRRSTAHPTQATTSEQRTMTCVTNLSEPREKPS
jgi:hypothetical protein